MKQAFPSIVDVNLRQLWRDFWTAWRRKSTVEDSCPELLSGSEEAVDDSREELEESKISR